MTSPRGMRCLCVALDVLTLSCCYQRVREEPDAGRDQLQRSHQRLQRDRRDCSHQRQNPRAASAPSNCAGCGPCPRARQGGTCTRAQRCADDRFKIMLVLLYCNGSSDSSCRGICDNRFLVLEWPKSRLNVSFLIIRRKDRGPSPVRSNFDGFADLDLTIHQPTKPPTHPSAPSAHPPHPPIHPVTSIGICLESELHFWGLET